MIALGHEDAAKRDNSYHESSAKCFSSPSKGYASSPPPNDSGGVAILEIQDGAGDQSQVVGNKNDPGLSRNGHMENSEECRQQRIYKHNYASWPVNPDSNAVPVYQINIFQGQFHPIAVNYRYQYAPVNSFHHNLQASQLQDFQYFVVIDFEATCDKGKIPHPQEIIEFPSVLVSSITGQLEACFQTYVRPTCNQVLTDFCKDLTGIQQIQVDRGVTLGEALLRHDKWLEKKGIKHTNFAVVTWSDWDCRVMLESECRYKKIRKPPYFNRWINLRVPFHEVFGGAKCNLKEAVETAGLSWQGRAHCGLDDAKNTARLLALIMRRGFKFSITNSLHCLAGEGSPSWRPPEDIKPHPTSHQTPHNLWEMQPLHPQAHRYCYCGVTSRKGVIQKPGPKQGSPFFGCGNWTAARGARCQYFEWASPLPH